MKILLLGGAGYLGSVLTQKLLMSDHSVTVVDTFWFGDNLPNPDENGLLSKVNLDIRNTEALKNEIEKADAVINIAAAVGPEMCDMIPKTAKEINLEAVKNMIPLVENKKFIFTSTCSVYGFNEEKFLDEDSTDFAAVSLYGRTKSEAEQMVHKQLPEATIFRLGTLYGYSPRMRFDLVANLFIAKAINGEKLTVNGGEQWRPMVHVQDVADGIIFALENNMHGIYNMVQNNYTIKLMAEIITAKYGNEYEVDPSKSDVRSTIAKNNKIRQRGFYPKRSILDAAKELENMECIKDYKNPIHYNAKYVSVLRERGLV